MPPGERLQGDGRSGYVIEQGEDVTGSQVRDDLAIILLGTGTRAVRAAGNRSPVVHDRELAPLTPLTEKPTS